MDALDWLAAMTSHVPNKGEQMVHYYGHYSNASRGLRQKKNRDDLIPSLEIGYDLHIFGWVLDAPDRMYRLRGLYVFTRASEDFISASW